MEKKCAGAQEEVLNLFNDYLFRNGKSLNTIKTYHRVLKSFCEWLEVNNSSIDNLTKENIQSYMHYLESEQKSASTVEKIYNTIRSFTRYLNQPQLTQDINYIKKNKDQTPPDTLTQNQTEFLLKEIKSEGNLRNIAIVYTLLFTGIRVSELCSLNKSDIKINGESAFLIVNNQETFKERIIPISKVVIIHLQRYIKSRNDDIEALFLSNYRKRISTRTVQHMLKRFGVHPQKLRHTFCYQLVRKGVNLSVVAQLAGHSDINITKQYSFPLRSEDLEQAIDKMFA